MNNIVTTTPKRKRKTSELAKNTFAAMEPYINVFCSGKKHDGEPKYAISQETLELLAKSKQGEIDLRYQKGHVFKDWHFYSNILKPKHIQAMLDGTPYYFTGGLLGKTLAMLDIDAHEAWQTDQDATLDRIIRFLGVGNIFNVRSSRGYNAFVKIEYPAVNQIYGVNARTQVNEALARFQKALKIFTADCLCTVELKGSLSISSDHYGTLAKLPCFGHWDQERLSQFEALPTVSLAWLEEAATSMIEAAQTRKTFLPIKKEAAIHKAGSVAAFRLDDDERNAMPEAIKQLRNRAYYCMAMREEVKKKGVKLIWTDYAIAFIVITFARKHNQKKYGDQMASAWCKYIWAELYNDGLVGRAFDDSRWSAITKTLGNCQFLNIIDNDFWHFRKPDGTKEKPGKAMEWRLFEEYEVVVEEKRGNRQEVYSSYTLNLWLPRLILDVVEYSWVDVEPKLGYWDGEIYHAAQQA